MTVNLDSVPGGAGHPEQNPGDPDFARAAFGLRLPKSQPPTSSPKEGNPWAENANGRAARRTGRRQWHPQQAHLSRRHADHGRSRRRGRCHRRTAEPLTVPRWSKEPGARFRALRPAVAFREQGRADLGAARQSGDAGHRHGRARRIHLLDGMITPNGLHYERSHSGMPDIDPDAAPSAHPRPGEPAARLHRSRRCRAIRWNRASPFSNAPATAARSTHAQAAAARTSQAIHGLLSCSEWTGVRLSTLLDEAGVDPARQMGAGRRRRCLRHEPQRSARQGDG